MHLTFFLFMSEDFKPREAGSVSCGVGQKVKDAATFPSRCWEGTHRLFALFSWWVQAWQLREGGMLSITLPDSFTHCQGKPECLSKGFATELTSDNKSMKSSSRGTQPQDDSHTPFPSLLSRDLCHLQLQTLALPVSCLPAAHSHLGGKMGRAW